MKRKIAVLLGGTSAERDVSIVTGIEIARALRNNGNDVTAIDCAYGASVIDDPDRDIKEIIRSTPSDIEKERNELNRNIFETVEFLLKEKFEVVFIALHGGYGENGQLQAVLDLAGIPYTGSGALASGLGINKHLSKLIFQKAGVPTAPWLPLKRWNKNSENEISRLNFPVVIKPNDQGSTVGLTIAKTVEELEDAVKLALSYSETAIAEQYIPGREITAAILGEEALPLVEIVPKSGIYDYESKYQAGMSQYITPALLPDEITTSIQQAAKDAYLSLSCRHYARVDFRLNERMEPYCLEVNTLPGMTATSLVPKAAKAIGVNFSELVDRIMEMAMAQL